MVNIERIEVLKGANAVLYGGGNGLPVGGMINLVSKLPQKEAFYEIGLKPGCMTCPAVRGLEPAFQRQRVVSFHW
jgi:outer membrane receptor for monomeric catechols